MCLTIKSGPHKVDKDHYVYKYVCHLNENMFYTPYRSFQMRFNKLYKSKIKVHKTAITKGIHSLSPLALVKRDYCSWMPYKFDTSIFPKAIALCIIPEGSTYYIGNNQDIVSDVIIPIEYVILNKQCDQTLEIHVGDIDSRFEMLQCLQKITKGLISEGYKML